MVGEAQKGENTMEQVREENVSKRKLGVVQGASFDTLIAALVGKSENAQVTFLHRLFSRLNGDTLAIAYKYAGAEIKRRVTNVNAG